MAININEPHLFLSYRKNGDPVRIGPLYSAYPNKIDIYNGSITYRTTNAELKVQDVTVPKYHLLSAIINPDTGIDIF